MRIFDFYSYIEIISHQKMAKSKIEMFNLEMEKFAKYNIHNIRNFKYS